MRKIGLFIIISVLLLSGCNKKEQMTNFIPTSAPSEEIEITPSASETTPSPQTIHVGQTTPKYVKLSEYNDVLNVRSAPSTDGDVVGFLVHTEKIDVIKIEDGWASFVYHDAICYVNADFLVDEKPEYLDPPTQAPKPTSGGKASTTSPDI